MKFQNEKKELWRYASKNLTSPAQGTNRPQPLPHRLPHQRPPQSGEFLMMTHPPHHRSFLGYCDVYGESSTSTMSMSQLENVSTPPPPYSSVPELDCSLNAITPNCCLKDGEMELSASATECKRKQAIKDGCNYVNTGDIMSVDDFRKMNESSTSTCYPLSVEVQTRTCQMPSQTKTSSSQAASTSITPSTSATTSFAATAAKILRNCCGATFGSSNSVTVIPATDATTNTCSKINYEHSQNALDYMASNSKNYLPEQYFSTLMKQLKSSQISSLLKAVKSRSDFTIPLGPASSTISSASSQRFCVANYQTNCILIRRAEILGEEPYVIACRLFFWRDLKNASQLKRLPVCPNERDPVYVCCNPLHWCRILETEIPPPPYQGQTMNRVEDINSKNAISSTSFGCTDPDNIRQNYFDIRARVSESVTTDGGARHCVANWCEVAYWEMAQRVGERYPADSPTINIFSDKPYASNGDRNEGMSLKELIGKRTTPCPEDVQHTRQKIGLGVTLSQESDGVWLYNRSTVPIFVYSPTLAESWHRVCRVEPGYCLRAFDKYRAQTLVHPAQLSGVQTGPIDKFSMRISFGKGWGCSYKRPDITLCPCWLEVLFNPQR